MRIQVLFFASIRDVVGSRQLELDVPDGSSVADLKESLIDRYPVLQGLSSSLSTAVNADYVEGSVLLKENDEVAFIPPVSGGLGCGCENWPF